MNSVNGFNGQETIMNSDIRISVNMPNHPKTKRLIRTLGAEAFYSLVSLWAYTAINKPDGDLTGLDAIDIAIAANWDGDETEFFDTICQMGFIDCNENEIVLHDWAEHNPYVVGSRDRSNKSRFNKLKSHYPLLHKELYEKGMRRISSSEYQAVVKQYLSTTQALLNDCSSPVPTPTPVPTPVPTPTPSPKERDITKDAMRPEYIPKELWSDLLNNRRFKKLQNTHLALTTFCNSVKLAIDKGFTVEQCIGEYVASSWNRFNHEWLTKGGVSGGTNCEICQYNQGSPCKNLSKEGFDRAKCQAYTPVGGR